MSMAGYQASVIRTLPDDWQDDKALLILALGLCGEAGELADHLKKVHGHGHPSDACKVMDEAGDVLWYLTAILTWHGLTLAQVAEHNVDKLLRRYPDGFDPERSRCREETS